MNLSASLASLESRVRSLRRKLAQARAQRVIHPMADEYCLEWARANADHKRVPETQPFISRIVKAGYRLLTFTPAVYYLERCRRRGLDPRPWELMRRLLPGGLPLYDPGYVAWNLPQRI